MNLEQWQELQEWLSDIEPLDLLLVSDCGQGGAGLSEAMAVASPGPGGSDCYLDLAGREPIHFDAEWNAPQVEGPILVDRQLGHDELIVIKLERLPGRHAQSLAYLVLCGMGGTSAARADAAWILRGGGEVDGA